MNDIKKIAFLLDPDDPNYVDEKKYVKVRNEEKSKTGAHRPDKGTKFDQMKDADDKFSTDGTVQKSKKKPVDSSDNDLDPGDGAPARTKKSTVKAPKGYKYVDGGPKSKEKPGKSSNVKKNVIESSFTDKILARLKAGKAGQGALPSARQEYSPEDEAFFKDSGDLPVDRMETRSDVRRRDEDELLRRADDDAELDFDRDEDDFSELDPGLDFDRSTPDEQQRFAPGYRPGTYRPESRIREAKLIGEALCNTCGSFEKGNPNGSPEEAAEFECDSQEEWDARERVSRLKGGGTAEFECDTGSVAAFGDDSDNIDLAQEYQKICPNCNAGALEQQQDNTMQCPGCEWTEPPAPAAGGHSPEFQQSIGIGCPICDRGTIQQVDENTLKCDACQEGWIERDGIIERTPAPGRSLLGYRDRIAEDTHPELLSSGSADVCRCGCGCKEGNHSIDSSYCRRCQEGNCPDPNEKIEETCPACGGMSNLANIEEFGWCLGQSRKPQTNDCVSRWNERRARYGGTT